MADIVNLRTIRKQMQREQKAESAAENRASFGRSKAAKAKKQAEENIANRMLDAHKLDRE